MRFPLNEIPVLKYIKRGRLTSQMSLKTHFRGFQAAPSMIKLICQWGFTDKGEGSWRRVLTIN